MTGLLDCIRAMSLRTRALMLRTQRLRLFAVPVSIAIALAGCKHDSGKATVIEAPTDVLISCERNGRFEPLGILDHWPASNELKPPPGYSICTAERPV